MNLESLVGKQVKATYIPLPYLGTGIIEPVEFTGTLTGLRVFRGRTYAIIEGTNSIIEKDVMDFQSVVAVGGAAAQSTEAKGNPPNYNRYQ